MAVIGHWVASFLLCYLVPQASVTLLCKMAMMSDFTCGFLLLAKVEGVAVFPWYLSTPPPAANATIQYWKESGQWLPGVDETASQGFLGFAALFPMYLDIPYSHSVLGMAIVGLLVAIITWLRYGIGFAYAMAIFLSAISHPILDMFFHDAYVLAGNRAVSRVTVNFWQIYYMEPVAFLLECFLAYGGYRLWWSTRKARGSDEATATKIAYYKRMFWTIAMSHNMASFYIVSPLAIFAMYKYFPAQQFATNDCYWGYAVFAFTMWSWTMALYPLHQLQQLTTLATEDVAGPAVTQQGNGRQHLAALAGSFCRLRPMKPTARFPEPKSDSPSPKDGRV